MSQEKVDAYKKEKVNRSANVEKAKKAQKRNKLIAKAVGCLCALAIIVALGFTASNQVKAYKGAQPDYNVDSMVVQDLCGVLDAETEVAAEE